MRPITEAVVTPWLVTVHRREPAFLPAMFGNVSKHVATSAEGHAAPPGYYLLTVWGFFLPWSVLLPMAMVRGWRRRKLPPVRFALAAVIGPWVFVECMLSKLPHYLLPAYPAMAFLTAEAIVLSLRSRKAELGKPEFLRGVMVWALFVLALGAVPWFAVGRFAGAPPLPTALITVAAAALAARVYIHFRRGRPRAALAAMGVGMLGLCVIVFAVYLPRADYLRTSVRVADVLQKYGVTGPGQVVMLDYKEPSLAFYQGGTIRESSNMEITNKLLDASPPWLVVTRKVWESPNTEASARGRLVVDDTFTGLDIAAGLRPVEVMVVHRVSD